MPYTALITAGTAALRSAAQELGRPALNWDVIADDQYVMREFCDWADTIPLMAGAVFSEMQGTLTRGDGRKNEWSQKEIDDQLTAAFGDKKNDIVAEFKQAFPRKKVQDVLYYAGGVAARREEPARRASSRRRKAPVYNYVFAWEYPINGGITSFHCSELAFCFHALSVPQIQTATGGGPVAMALQDKVSQAWINFAKTGNPQPAGTRVEAVHEGGPAGDGVRHRQPVGRAPRRQARVAAAGGARWSRWNTDRRGRPTPIARGKGTPARACPPLSGRDRTRVGRSAGCGRGPHNPRRAQ